MNTYKMPRPARKSKLNWNDRFAPSVMPKMPAAPLVEVSPAIVRQLETLPEFSCPAPAPTGVDAVLDDLRELLATRYDYLHTVVEKIDEEDMGVTLLQSMVDSVEAARAAEAEGSQDLAAALMRDMVYDLIAAINSLV